MDMILKNTFQSISPAYELIGDVPVGSNTTQVDFTGLNIGKDDELLLVSEYVRGSSGYGTLLMACDQNGTLKTTISDYWLEELSSSSTTITGYRGNANAFSFASAVGAKTLGIAKLKLTNSGYFVWQNAMVREVGTASIMQYDIYGTSNFTTNSITQLRLYLQSGAGINAGSRFQLYKLVAEKVADIIVPTNTTSVDITGLNIGKDGEYYLVSDIVNPTGATSSPGIFFNGNNSVSSYYVQRLTANSTTVSGQRQNYNYMTNMVSGSSAISFCNIKLTNSGYAVYQANTNTRYGTSNTYLEKAYNSPTFTLSEIASIRLLADVANGIGANSRFTLYKMK